MTSVTRAADGSIPVDRDIVGQVLHDHAALRHGDTDPELDAVRTAILIEDVFGVTLSDADIDPAALADPLAVAALVARLQEAV
jgi:hypothetical protein